MDARRRVPHRGAGHPHRGLALGLLAVALAACAGLRARKVHDEAGKSRRPGAPALGAAPATPAPDGGPQALAALLRRWGKPADADAIGRALEQPGSGNALGFDLRRFARRAGLVALELKPLETAAAKRLLEQGVPVLASLDAGLGQRYVLIMGWDAARDRWALREGREPVRTVSTARLLKRWSPSGQWALVAFPPERPIEGLAPAEHLEAADRAAELGRLDAARWHLGQAGLAGKPWNAQAALRLAALEKAAGDWAAAETDDRKAMELDPRDPGAANDLALLLARRPGMLAEAERLARKAVGLARLYAGGTLRLASSLDTLAGILAKEGQAARAAQAFRAALFAAPKGSELARQIEAHRQASL